MTIPFAPTALDHVVIRGRDIATLIAFYRDVLGCPMEKEQAEIGLYQLRAGDALIDLVDVDGKIGREGGPPPGRDGHNLDHFCIRVAPFDAEAIRRHLDAHKVDHGEVATRYGAGGHGPSIYATDPEGNTVELKGPATP